MQPPGTVGGDSTAELLRRARTDETVKAEPTAGDTTETLDTVTETADESTGITKRVVIDVELLGMPLEPLLISVDDYFERLRPMVQRTISALSEVMQPGGATADGVDDLKQRARESGVAGVYVVGGASALGVSGAVSMNDVRGGASAYVDGATVTASGGSISVTALEDAKQKALGEPAVVMRAAAVGAGMPPRHSSVEWMLLFA